MLAIISEEWRSVVCQCPRAWPDASQLGYPRRTFSFDDTRLFTCNVCGKPSSHCIYKCVNCSDVFLKDFSSPRWLLSYPRCWICCEQDSDLATTIELGTTRQKRIPPTLRYLYIHITEGFKPASLFDSAPLFEQL